jgi:hypothetical protein
MARALGAVLQPDFGGIKIEIKSNIGGQKKPIWHLLLSRGL